MDDTQKDQVVSEGWDSLPDDIKNDLIIQVFKELSLVKDHTRLLVLVTHGFIELLVHALVDHNLKNSKKSRRYPHATKLLILNELGILNDDQYKVFDWFRVLRNKAAHQAIFQVTKNDLSKIKGEKYQDPANFYGLCVELIGGIWNQHIPIFGPKYAPGQWVETDS